jgi:hypothetical protein
MASEERDVCEDQSDEQRGKDAGVQREEAGQRVMPVVSAANH